VSERAPRSASLRWSLIAIAALLFVGGLLLDASAPEADRRAPLGGEQALREVAVLRVDATPLRARAEVAGVLEPRRTVLLFSETHGAVTRIGAEKLDFVESGLILVEIDPLLAEVAVERARAAVTRSRSELALARANLERRSSLADRGVASTAALDDAENAEAVAAAALREASAQLTRARDDLAKKVIRAPFDGTLRSFEVEVGEYVRVGQRLGELLDPAHFTERLREVMEYHNHALQHYFKTATVDYQQVLDEALAQGEQIAPLVADIPGLLHSMRRTGRDIMFEGAQGALLDIDHGTYPYVTSSTTTAGGAASGSGVGPRHIDYVLGIVKAYTTRVGAGPFPTELFDEVGAYLGKQGHEFGATTGRQRRCGWLDTVALRRSLDINSVSGMCITKLDVLDGLDTLKIAVSYKLNGETVITPPAGADLIEQCEPEYIEMPGWSESTVGVKTFDALPAAAKAYLNKVEELCETPIAIVSTGPDRAETIVLKHPFE